MDGSRLALHSVIAGQFDFVALSQSESGIDSGWQSGSELLVELPRSLTAVVIDLHDEEHSLEPRARRDHGAYAQTRSKNYFFLPGVTSCAFL